MTALIFLIFAGIAVFCGISLVAQTHPIASALSLIGVMGSLALLYLQLGGEFIAAAQMIVYAGAIMVLFVFVIMLLNAGAEATSRQIPLLNRYLGMLLLAAFLGPCRLPPSGLKRQWRSETRRTISQSPSASALATLLPRNTLTNP